MVGLCFNFLPQCAVRRDRENVSRYGKPLVSTSYSIVRFFQIGHSPPTIGKKKREIMDFYEGMDERKPKR